MARPEEHTQRPLQLTLCSCPGSGSPASMAALFGFTPWTSAFCFWSPTPPFSSKHIFHIKVIFFRLFLPHCMVVPVLHDSSTFKLFFMVLYFLTSDLGFSMGKKHNDSTWQWQVAATHFNTNPWVILTGGGQDHVDKAQIWEGVCPRSALSPSRSGAPHQGPGLAPELCLPPTQAPFLLHLMSPASPVIQQNANKFLSCSPGPEYQDNRFVLGFSTGSLQEWCSCLSHAQDERRARQEHQPCSGCWPRKALQIIFRQEGWGLADEMSCGGLQRLSWSAWHPFLTPTTTLLSPCSFTSWPQIEAQVRSPHYSSDTQPWNFV